MRYSCPQQRENKLNLAVFVGCSSDKQEKIRTSQEDKEKSTLPILLPPAEELTPLLEGSVTTGYKRCIVCDSAELCDALDSHGFAALTAQLNFNTLLSSVNSMYDFHYFTAQTLWSQN